MSLPQTELKGSVTLASDTNAITTIGVIGSGSTSINSATTNIQAGTQTTNTKVVNIGQTTGAFNTTTTMNGITTILKPTISRPISFSGFTAPTAGQMFFNNRVNTGGFFTGTTTYKAYAPINNLTEGVYLFLGFVYLADYSPVTKIASSICFSGSPIANDQTGGFTIVNENTLEAYGYKATTGATGGNWTMNLSTVYQVPASPNNNIAVAVQTGVSANGLYVDLKYCRLA